MTNIEIINEILSAIPEIARVSREHDIKHGIDPDSPIRRFGEGGPERIAEINQPTVDIQKKLTAIPKNQMVSVITIMYFGRDGADSIPQLRDHCSATFATSAIIARHIIGKRYALPRYFQSAFENAARKGIDLNKI